MSIIHLEPKNFHVSGRQKKTLNTNVRGPALVFFKSQKCPTCRNFEPIFYSLSNSHHGMVFAIADLTLHREIVRLSMGTVVQIKSVPCIIFYHDGVPKTKYTGEFSMNALSRYISGMMKDIRAVETHQKQFMRSNPYNRPPSGPSHVKFMPEISDGVLDDTTELKTPAGIIPYNTPWEAEMRKA